MADTLRLRNSHQDGKDYGPNELKVRDSENYEWNFGPNESRVLPDDGNRLTLASNATVLLGQDTAQREALDVVSDEAEQPARV